jgi:hypothetical protein
MAESATICWPLQHHYHCSACGWIGLQSDYPEAPERCPCCGAKPDGSDAFREGTYNRPKLGWTCYHCGETFMVPGLAAEHFGASPMAEPGCLIRVKRGDERGLLFELREAEAELERYRAEDSDTDRRMAAMASEHGDALRREEEKGYARGLRDQRQRDIEIAVRVKQGLRNGGARNACDAIAATIADYDA